MQTKLKMVVDGWVSALFNKETSNSFRINLLQPIKQYLRSWYSLFIQFKTWLLVNQQQHSQSLNSLMISSKVEVKNHIHKLGR